MGQRRSGGRNNRREERSEFDERIIDITRVAKVIKGGRRFAFRVTVVVGDNKGRVALGTGKARGVPDAIRKAIERARTQLQNVVIVNGTIPHEVLGEHGAAKVLLRPASPGTGVIAGGGVRSVIEAAGYQNILSKSLGSNNKLNVMKATMNGLNQLKDMRQLADERGKDIVDVAPFWSRKEWRS